MTATTLRRRFAPHPLLVVWLTAVWVMLWSDLSLANVLAGAVVAMLATTLLPLNPVPFHARLHPRGTAVLLAVFARDLVVASYQVAVLALRPRRVPKGAVIRVRLRSHSDVVLTMTSELLSLVPGSIVVEAHRFTGTLYVHVLDVEMAGGLEQAREHALAQEERVLYAIAPREEIIAAGLPARPRRRRPGSGGGLDRGPDGGTGARP
ncbi:MAG TPA: Na+/H+ antiporter subunit E [Actinotalea sp.]|nr:Na+/H+ antiporter subunit E [Actinotalea sp.]